MQRVSRFTGSAAWPRLASLLLLALIITFSSSGCRKDADMMDDRDASQLYRDAYTHMTNKSWDRAIMAYKMLQTRYPFGRYTEEEWQKRMGAAPMSPPCLGGSAASS